MDVLMMEQSTVERHYGATAPLLTNTMLLFTFAIAASMPIAGQSSAAVRSVLIQYTEGSVFLVRPKADQTSPGTDRLETGQGLRTMRGRAEIQLMYGWLLRVDEQSEIQLYKDDAGGIRINLRQGRIALDLEHLRIDDGLSLSFQKSIIRFQKAGEYHLEAIGAVPAQLKVLRGAAVVEAFGGQATVPARRAIELSPQHVASSRKNSRAKGPFDLWIADRRKLLGRTLSLPDGVDALRDMPCLNHDGKRCLPIVF
jgi:hypothetical protein